jgi:DDE domain
LFSTFSSRVGATKAAKRLLRKLLRKQGRAPRVLITDKLRSYAAAKRETMPGVEHRQHKGLNNRAEISHQPTRRRERIMKRFKSPRHVQRFLSIHEQIANVFSRRPTQDTAAKFRTARNQAFTTWAEVTRVTMAAYYACHGRSIDPLRHGRPALNNLTMPMQVLICSCCDRGQIYCAEVAPVSIMETACSTATFQSYINGHQRASGGPTFTGCQQPIGQDWFTSGHLPSTWTLDGNA